MINNTSKWNYFVFKRSSGSFNRKVAVFAPNKEIAKYGLGFTEDEKVVLLKETPGSLILLQKTKIRPKELIVVLQALQKCMKAGASISKALEIAAFGVKHPLTRGVIGVLLWSTAKNGLQLSAAMEKMNSLFDQVMIAMIKAGERSGKLPFILEDLAKRMEQASNIRSKTLTSLYYPIFVIGLTIVGATIVNFFVFPSIMSNFKMMDAKLPPITQFMIDFVGFTGNNPGLLLIPIGGIISLFLSRKRIAGSNCLQRQLIRLPIVGQLIAGSIFERSLSTLSLLQKSGINIVDAYKMTIEVSGNIAFKEYFSSVLEHIKVGNTPDKAFFKERYRLGKHSAEVANLMKVASFTGEDWKALGELANSVAEDVKLKAEALPKLIQPILLVFIALIVGFMIAAVYLPSFYLLLNVLRN